MISFTCNICGAANQAQEVPWEPPSCSRCKSNVRMRALIHLLATGVFGEGRALKDFPADRRLKGFGLSDEACYAVPLAKKLDYTNTYFDRDPFLDLTVEHPELHGTCDFILSSDVFEHIAPPIERAFAEAFALLKPNGILCITVPSSAGEIDTVEYYPDLYAYSVIELGGEYVLINRKKNGTLEIHQDLEFHGGTGATLVMRMFSQRDLERQLREAGFAEVSFQCQPVEASGIFFEGSWGRPLMARKGSSGLPAAAVRRAATDKAAEAAPIDSLDDRTLQLHQEKANLERRIAALESQLRVVSDSRWLKLGRRLGFGPKLR